MAVISVRGLEAQALAELKVRAVEQGASVNTLVLRLIAQGLGHAAARPVRRRHDDLDALAGTWKQADGAEFDAASAAFGEVDPALWK